MRLILTNKVSTDNAEMMSAVVKLAKESEVVASDAVVEGMVSHTTTSSCRRGLAKEFEVVASDAVVKGMVPHTATSSRWRGPCAWFSRARCRQP